MAMRSSTRISLERSRRNVHELKRHQPAPKERQPAPAVYLKRQLIAGGYFGTGRAHVAGCEAGADTGTVHSPSSITAPSGDEVAADADDELESPFWRGRTASSAPSTAQHPPPTVTVAIAPYPTLINPPGLVFTPPLRISFGVLSLDDLDREASDHEKLPSSSPSG